MRSLPLTLFLAALACAQTPVPHGVWEGVVGNGIPFRIEFRGGGDQLTGTLLNGNERSPSTRGSFHNGHLVLEFDDYLNRVDATVADGELRGTFGGHARSIPLVAHAPHADAATPVSVATGRAPDIAGDWEVAVPYRPKGEPAWKLHVQQRGASVSAVILRVDGDTGRLYGSFSGGAFTVSKFNADGAALWVLRPQPDGTLALLLRGPQGEPLVARRPQAARADALAPPDDPGLHTTMLDPAQPLQFRFPDLDGHIVSNTDARFQGKVLVVSIGGSWCPNCHDEAPFLEALQRKYRGRGLEVIELDFEEADQLRNPTRLRTLIARDGIDYTVLLAGEPGQLAAKLPQVANLNCWPTTFFVGRDGLVKAIHAGFAGPATPENATLRAAVDAQVNQLLRQPAAAAAAAARPPS